MGREMEKEEIKFSAGLFRYWDVVRHPSFDWRVTSYPSFIAYYIKDGAVFTKPMLAKTRKLRIYQTPEAENNEFAAEMIYEKTTLEMELLSQESNCNRVFVHSMFQTPVLYDPMTFNPRRGFMIRYAFLALNDGEEIQEISHEYDGHNFTSKFYHERGMSPIEWVRKNDVPTRARTEEEMRKQEEYETMILVRKIKRQLGYIIDEETPVF